MNSFGISFIASGACERAFGCLNPTITSEVASCARDLHHRPAQSPNPGGLSADSNPPLSRPSGGSEELGVSDDLVREEGEAVTDGLGVDEARGFFVALRAERIDLSGLRDLPPWSR